MTIYSSQDNIIRQLEDQAAIIKASSSSSELQQRCSALQEQIDEMEVSFMADLATCIK